MQQQGHEQPRLTDARGELLQLKLQNIQLVLIERSQTTQSIAVCYVWDCTAADQPAFPRGLPVHC